MKNKKVMLYLEESEYKRLAESARQAGTSMNKFVAGLIWNHDAPTRVAGELTEYKCSHCGKTTWLENWAAAAPTRCPYEGCNGQLLPRGRWGTVVLGRLEPVYGGVN